MPDASNFSQKRAGPGARGIVLALVAIFAVLSAAAEWKKSITVDELVYTVAGYITLHTGDYRMNPEHPPLWRMWATLHTLDFPLNIDYRDRDWQQMPMAVFEHWAFAVRIGFRTPGNDAEKLIWRCRPMMILIGMMLALLIARWSRQLGGGVAAATAATLFCLDPNFLVHSSLVTNDVPVTFALLLASYAIWRLGIRFTLWRTLLLGIGVGLCMNTKLSGLIIVPLVIGLLSIRVLVAGPWLVNGKIRQTRRAKLVPALAATLCCAVVGYGITWASYGFRYSAVADGSQRLNVPRVINGLAHDQVQAKYLDRPPTAKELAAWKPPAGVRLTLWMMNHHIMPEGWLFGVLFSIKNAQAHTSFLLGRMSDNGWWYYFPLVILFKTPTATLVSIAGAAAIVVRQVMLRRGALRELWQRQGWISACLGLPLMVYATVAMLTPLDIGIRYILPAFPWIYIATGAVAAYAWRQRPRLTIRVGAALALALAAETAVAFPNYLAFFNVLSGGARNGIHLLGDSNLDWGQDLPALHDWQQAHPEADLYLCYFGSADPAFYGIRYTPLPGGYTFERRPRVWPTGPCTIAISTTRLQGIYLGDALRARYAKLLRGKPIDCLGGSIYLFNVDPDKTMR